MMLADSTSHCFLAGNKLRLCLGSEALIFALGLRKISKAYHLVTRHKRIYRPETFLYGYVPASRLYLSWKQIYLPRSVSTATPRGIWERFKWQSLKILVDYFSS